MPFSELRHRPMTCLKLYSLYELIIMDPKFMSNMVHEPLAPLYTCVQIFAVEYHSKNNICTTTIDYRLF